MIWSSQCGSVKGKSCLTDLIAFHDETDSVGDESQWMLS